MGTVFWVAEGCILVEFLSRGNHRCCWLLSDAPEALSCISWQTSREETDHPATQRTVHHTAALCMEKIQKNNWELLPHSPYSLDLAPFYYHLFSFIKDLMCSQNSVTDKAVQEAFWYLWTAEMEFYCTSGMVAKVCQSGWGFCTEVNTVHRFEWHALF